MMLEKLARWAVPGALLMAGAWFLSGIVALAMPGGQGLGDVGETRFYVIELLHGVGQVGLLAAVAGLYVYQKSAMGRLGNTGFWAALVGSAFAVVATPLGVLAVALTGEANLVIGMLFGLGLLGWLVGFTLLGIATIRGGSMPAWVGGLLIAFFPAIIVLFLVLDAYGVGGVMVGLIWLAIAYGIAQAAPVSAGIEAVEPVGGGG